eukprot:scaffold173893_cov24-Tisochrysis_lutea.AAC.2
MAARGAAARRQLCGQAPRAASASRYYALRRARAPPRTPHAAAARLRRPRRDRAAARRGYRASRECRGAGRLARRARRRAPRERAARPRQVGPTRRGGRLDCSRWRACRGFPDRAHRASCPALRERAARLAPACHAPRLGLSQFTARLEEDGEIVERSECVAVMRAEHLALRLECLAVEHFCLVELALALEKQRQVVHRDERLRVARAERLAPAGKCLTVEYLGLGEFPSRVEQQRQVVGRGKARLSLVELALRVRHRGEIGERGERVGVALAEHLYRDASVSRWREPRELRRAVSASLCTASASANLLWSRRSSASKLSALIVSGWCGPITSRQPAVLSRSTRSASRTAPAPRAHSKLASALSEPRVAGWRAPSAARRPSATVRCNASASAASPRIPPRRAPRRARRLSRQEPHDRAVRLRRAGRSAEVLRRLARAHAGSPLGAVRPPRATRQVTNGPASRPRLPCRARAAPPQAQLARAVRYRRGHRAGCSACAEARAVRAPPRRAGPARAAARRAPRAATHVRGQLSVSRAHVGLPRASTRAVWHGQPRRNRPLRAPSLRAAKFPRGRMQVRWRQSARQLGRAARRTPARKLRARTAQARPSRARGLCRRHRAQGQQSTGYPLSPQPRAPRGTTHASGASVRASLATRGTPRRWCSSSRLATHPTRRQAGACCARLRLTGQPRRRPAKRRHPPPARRAPTSVPRAPRPARGRVPPTRGSHKRWHARQMARTTRTDGCPLTRRPPSGCS